MNANGAPHPLLPVERELCDRVRWFVRLRWAAGVAVLLLGAALRGLLGWQVAAGVDAVGAAVLLYNIVFWRLVQRLEPYPRRQTAWSHLANLQVSVDLIFLVILIHFTGGFFSPLLAFAVFHIMIASLLLRRRDVFLQAGLATALVTLMGWARWSGGLPAETMGGRLPDMSALPFSAPCLILLGFAGLLIITAYLASTIGYALRQRERQLMATQENLQRACEQLEELDRSKTQFTRMVTHELRSPVAALQSMLDVLRQGYTGELPEAAARLVERAGRRTEVLLELVNQLLDLARERARIAPRRTEAVAVAALFQETEEAYRTQAEAKGLCFQVVLPPPELALRGDPDELQKLLSNLVSNAVKYTLTGGQVVLRCRQENAQAAIEVRDTGIGIPAGERDQLFTEFFRASNAKRVAEHGTGLGLALVQRIVEVHGGRLELETEEGQGTIFTIHLPAAVDRAGNGTPDAGSSPATGSPDPASG